MQNGISVPVQILSKSSERVQRLAFDSRLGRAASKWERAFTTTSDGLKVTVGEPGSSYIKLHFRGPGLDMTI